MAILECDSFYTLYDSDNKETDRGNCSLKLEEEMLLIMPVMSAPLVVDYRDIASFAEKDYSISISFIAGEKLVISNLGYSFDDFLRIFAKLRNKVLLKDLLMNESIKKSGVKADFEYYDGYKDETRKGKCELRLYETGIVIVPEKNDIKRIPYSLISKIDTQNHTLTIATNYGDKFTFSMIGSKFDPLIRTLSSVNTELQLQVQSQLKELLPDEGPLIIRKAGEFMKEGLAAKRSDIESVSEPLWAKLEQKLKDFEIIEEYNFLKEMSQKEKICIGIKRGLMGDLTGEYIWFLIPIYGKDAKESGNAIAMEATSEAGKGKATYFFRIVGREKYHALSLKEMDTKTDEFIKTINHCMLEINFRREPIYLTDEKLNEPKYKQYRYAISKIPSLQKLRSLFVGRVIHRSEEQWEQDVINLLKFNVSSLKDSEKWSKTQDYELS